MEKRTQAQTYPRRIWVGYDRGMKKTIDLNFQQAFAIEPEGVRFCPRGICRRTRRCLPPLADELTYRCAVVPRKVWDRHRRKILEMAKRILYERDAAQMAERRAGDKAGK